MGADRLVSAMVPVHDGRRYLGDALESIFAQTHRAVEAIVVDDGSTDGSADLARDLAPDARVVSQPRQGEAAARNRAISMARGTHLAFLDADDIWAPDKLELQLSALDAHPDVDLVFGQQRQFRSPELGTDGPRFAGENIVQPAVTWGTMFLERSTFDRVGSVRPGLRMGAFLDWLVRARELGLRELILPDILFERRLHPHAHSIQNRAHIGDYARILKGALDRRRGAG